MLKAGVLKLFVAGDPFKIPDSLTPDLFQEKYLNTIQSYFVYLVEL